MNILTKAARSLGPRVIGGALSMVAGWIFVHTKGVVTIDPQQAQDMAQAVGTKVVEVVGTMIGTYAVTHRVASALGINPGDAASATLAKAEKTALDTGSAVVPTPPIH